MKKMTLSAFVLGFAITSAFAQAAPAAAPAAPEKKVEAAAAPAPVAEEKKVEAAAAPAPVAEEKKAEAAAAPAPVAEEKKVEAAAAPAPVAKEKKVEAAAAPAPVAEEKKAEAAAAPAPVTEENKAEAAAAPAPVAEENKVEAAAAPAPVAEEKKVEATEEVVEEVIEEEIIVVKKKPKLVEKDKFSFDILAEFEIQAGKVLWASEDDENGDNLEEWNGQANLAAVVESEDFAGKIALEFYPIDNDISKAERDSLDANDYFAVTEAWAWQSTKYFNFKLGRWDNTDKNGDYFGGYVDGYLAGFRSSQESENQVQFGFTPIEYLALNIGLISTGKNLNTGDLRVDFSFQNLPSIERLQVNFAYRSNLFDEVNDSEADIEHNVSFKAFLPIIKDHLAIFGEAALLGLDGQEEKTYVDSKGRTRRRTVDSDWYFPITGGIMIETPVVDRIILEAEYVADREDSPYKTPGKHVKDVLGAVYLEKSLTDRFTLSAGVHSFGSTKDWVINGNLVGTIN